ncbi:MAG: STAS domain-containing protein [Aquimonas sp.]|jgi:ABC-type transporter Mla MlaB component|nr:STAS domain-containing protein [Aquimonas sp.]
MSKTESSAATFVIGGALTLSTAAALWSRWQREGQQAIRVDLAGCTDIDTTGLACLRQMQATAACSGRTLAWQHLPSRLQAICIAHRVPLPGDAVDSVDASCASTR